MKNIILHIITLLITSMHKGTSNTIIMHALRDYGILH